MSSSSSGGAEFSFLSSSFASFEAMRSSGGGCEGTCGCGARALW